MRMSIAVFARPKGRHVAVFAVLALLLCWLPALAAAPTVHADGATWVVSVGDSYISGEAGRWAGNADGDPSSVDALGPTAYDDNPAHDKETIPLCHRSRSAEVYIGGGVDGLNLACSGAETSTEFPKGVFKPGIDFYDSGGREGQALMLEKFAASHTVKLVALSIGGNNFDFSKIVEDCVKDYLIPVVHVYCSDKSPVTTELAPSNVARQQDAIEGAILNVAKAMTDAGYSSSQYAILVQDYPSPIPDGAGFRYPQTYARLTRGGCAMWDRDADAVNATMLPTINRAIFKAAEETKLPNLKTMDISSAFDGHRLCEKGVGQLKEEGLHSWKDPGAVNKTEWLSQVRTLSTIFGPYQLQEDLHPNYWGQLALRNCLTQAYNDGTPRGGTCTYTGPGLNPAGEPNMSLH